jgi:hypothetical protein
MCAIGGGVYVVTGRVRWVAPVWPKQQVFVPGDWAFAEAMLGEPCAGDAFAVPQVDHSRVVEDVVIPAGATIGW